jgi:hypothetical protein
MPETDRGCGDSLPIPMTRSRNLTTVGLAAARGFRENIGLILWGRGEDEVSICTRE